MRKRKSERGRERKRKRKSEREKEREVGQEEVHSYCLTFPVLLLRTKDTIMQSLSLPW